MADELVSMAEQFKGLDMGALIGGPLIAVCEANRSLALSTADYVDKVGMNDTLGADGKPTGQKEARMVTFTAKKPTVDADGKVTTQEVTFQAPLLALVEVPSLFVRKVEIRFNMEVKSSFTESKEKSASASVDASVKYGWGLGSVSARVQGNVASKDTSTRTSDNTAKYDVYVVAEDRGMPEGMAKVLNIMQGLIAPTEVKTLSDSSGAVGAGPVAAGVKSPVKAP